MPPRKRGRGRGGGATRGRGNNKKTRKVSSSEDEAPISDVDDQVFDKNRLQAVKYDFEQLMNDPVFNHPELIGKIDPKELDQEYYHKTGLDIPLYFKCDPKLLGMSVPDGNFTVKDVLDLVGGDRMIEVVKVSDQGSVKMSLEEFINFYTTPEDKREILYNVLSLEFSQTKLQDFVKSPELVRQIDWVGNRWPDALRQRWISFNTRDKKTYTPHHTFPKVQNYCLMSVAKCYTDFHIDFSGTSVWYHVLKGKKVFWLIPPTETNFLLYQEFIQTPDSLNFFGKSVETCHMAVLSEGDTMLIPSGWIHAVYTPIDSLVFGGNFLHSLSCRMQLRVYQCENRLNITKKFRLPYNEELIFYVLADYVKKWTGREYARPLKIKDSRLDYCGDFWMQNGGHRKKVEYEDYANGVHLDTMGDDAQNDGGTEVKVIAMHAENSLYATMAADGALNADRNEEEDEDLDELARTNPLIFYKNSRHDFVRNKCVPDHKLPVCDEPPIEINEEEVEKMTGRLVEELDALVSYIRKKAKVEIAEGICNPSSLLACAAYVLNKRKVALGLMEDETRVIETRRRKRQSEGSFLGTPKKQSKKEDLPEDFPDDFLDEEEKARRESLQSGPLHYVAAGFEESDDEAEKAESALARDQRAAKYAAKKEEELEEKVSDVEMNEVEDKDAKKKEKEKKKLEEKRMKKEKKEAEKRRKSEDMKATPKNKKKLEKAQQYVGGMPMHIMPTEALPSPYNYDPMNEITKLGQGQLKSAYRKSKTNIEAPKVKKIYKIDGVKTISIDDNGEPSTSSPHEASQEPATSAPKMIAHPEVKSPTQPLNVDVFEMGRIPKKKNRTESVEVERKTSAGNRASLQASPAVPRPRTESLGKSRPVGVDRRRSGETTRRATYMPVMSRQDRLITDGMPLEPIVNKPTKLPAPSLLSPKPTKRLSTDVPYTPTAPKMSSWIPAVDKKMSNSTVGSDSPIDVVELTSPTSSQKMTPNTPLSLNTSLESSRPEHLLTSPRSSASVEANNGKALQSPATNEPKIPTEDAIRELKRLTAKLKEVT